MKRPPSEMLRSFEVTGDAVRSTICALEARIGDAASSTIERRAAAEARAVRAIAADPRRGELAIACARAEIHLMRLDELLCQSAARAAARSAEMADRLALVEESHMRPVPPRFSARAAVSLSRRLLEATR